MSFGTTHLVYCVHRTLFFFLATHCVRSELGIVQGRNPVEQLHSEPRLVRWVFEAFSPSQVLTSATYAVNCQ